MFATLVDRIVLGGYELAKSSGLLAVIGRLSRGNTAVQDGQILDDSEIAALRTNGQKALRSLSKLR